MMMMMTLVSADDGSDSSNCAMDIWIFSSFDSCQASDAPVANGKLYADGQCHAIETDLDPSDPSYSSFPGNYRVQCIDTNKVRFYDSACLDETCSSTSLVTSGTAVCDRDNTSPASLYSRLEPPEYAVQDPANANVGAFYTCLKLDGSDVSVTFVVFGDCTQSGCVITPTTPTTTTTTAPTPAIVVAPTPTTTTTTNVPLSTPAPLTTTFPPATAVPASIAPFFNGTTTTTAPVPAFNTSSTAPSSAPITTTTIAPVLAPKAVTVAPIVPSTPTVSKPTTNVAAPTKGLVNDVISVAIRLSPMNTTIDIASDSISRWEDVTMDQIRSVAESDVYNAIIYGMDISNMTQIVIDLTANNASSKNDAANRQQRSLQEGDDSGTVAENVTTISTGTTKAMALQIMFDVSMSYTPSTTASTSTTLADLFTASFDSEQDRSNYLIKLVTNDDLFTSVRLVEVIYVNGTNIDSGGPSPTVPATPVMAPTSESTSNSDEQSSSGLLIALAGGGTALIVFAIFGIVFYQRMHNHNSGGSKNSKENITNEVETPSDNDEYYGGNGPVGPLNFNHHRHHHDPNSPISPSQQRWTNEIVVDPSADDVSTLGGSVLAGYLDPTNANNNNNNNHVEDEPTASVNLDFDYNNNQYRVDAEDRSRTVFTETTGPTNFTNFTSKLGMNGAAMFSDDASFDELYAEIDDETDTNDKTTNHATLVQHPSHLNHKKIANMVKPFEIRAPPGKLGMVVDTPNGGVPVVRAIRPDSVLHGNVLVGDRLISVDNKDVTNLTALEVSSLISLKQHQHRLLVFCRLQQQSSTPIVSTTAAVITPQSSALVQPSPVGTAMATTSN